MGSIGATNSFSNYPSNFKIQGLQELKDFVGTRSQLYNLIAKTNPIAVIDRREAHVWIGDDSYILVMQKVPGGQRLRLIWKLHTKDSNGGQYFIQSNEYMETPGLRRI